MFLTSSLFTNQHPITHLWAVQKYRNQLRQDLDCMLGGGAVRIVSMATTAVMRLSTVMMHNSICQHSSGQLKSQNSVKITLLAESTLLNFLVLGSDASDIFLQVLSSVHVSSPVKIHWRKASHPPKYCCKNWRHISKHAHLCSYVSCFCTHLLQISWYLMSSLMMEYADPQLMYNLSAISVTVIHLFSWTRALTFTILSATHKVVGWPKWSSLMMLVLWLQKLSTHWYTLLCITQFFSILY